MTCSPIWTGSGSSSREIDSFTTVVLSGGTWAGLTALDNWDGADDTDVRSENIPGEPETREYIARMSIPTDAGTPVANQEASFKMTFEGRQVIALD